MAVFGGDSVDCLHMDRGDEVQLVDRVIFVEAEISKESELHGLCSGWALVCVVIYSRLMMTSMEEDGCRTRWRLG